MDTDLPTQYNEGLVPAPKTGAEPLRLHRPTWQPTPAQVELARKMLVRNLFILALIMAACLILFALAWGL